MDGLDALLDEEHWEAHIVFGHPEMHGNFGLVIDTLQNATAVFRSKRDPETRIYLKEHASVTLGNRLMEQITLRVYVREPIGSWSLRFLLPQGRGALGKKYGLRN